MAEDAELPQPSFKITDTNQDNAVSSHPLTQTSTRADSTNEADAGEGRVREKLKQTSIDSKTLIRDILGGNQDESANTLTEDANYTMEVPEGGNMSEVPDDKSGRAAGKRSLEELDTPESHSQKDEELATSPIGHVRKRSKGRSKWRRQSTRRPPPLPRRRSHGGRRRQRGDCSAVGGYIQGGHRIDWSWRIEYC